MKHARRKMKVCACLLACLALLGLAGCGCGSPRQKATELAMEKAVEAAARAHGQDVQVDLNSEGPSTVTVREKDGAKTMTISAREGVTQMHSTGPGGKNQSMTVGEKVTVPDTFPKDVPLPQDFTATAAIYDESGPSWTVQGKVPRPLAEVRDFYAGRLGQSGWTPQVSLDTAELVSLTFEKDARVLSVMAGPEDGATVLSVAVSPR